MKRVLIGVCALLVVSALALSPAALARTGGGGGLDRSYGVDGVAAVAQPPGDHLNGWRIERFASARTGAIYVLGSGVAGNCYSCLRTYVLFRLAPSGAFDPGFGGETGVVLPVAPVLYGLAVDERGRALVSGRETDAVTVRRFTASGQLDQGFGKSGVASVACQCQTASAEVMPARRGKLLVEADRASSGEEYSPGPGAEVALTRLLANGQLDLSFGKGGSIAFSLPSRTRPRLVAVAGKGSILLGGSSQRVNTIVYVVRVSAKGKLDTRFNRTASGSMRRLARLGEFPELSSLLPRGDGTIELLGRSQFTQGFDLRLRANGRLAKGFGKNGLSVLPLPVWSATLGSGGAIFAATETPQTTAFRILKNGTLDRRFGGAEGKPVPVQGEGILVGTQEGRRAVVMDLGKAFCRSGSCPPTPAVARYVEPPPIHHRHR